MDARSEAVAREVKAALALAYGDRLAAVYAFGSRARGDFHAESDLDLAVVLRDPPIPLTRADDALIEVTYPIELNSGLVIHAWSLSADAMGDNIPQGFRAKLVDTVRREGLPI